MLIEVPKIYSVAEQRAEVRKTTTRRSYQKLISGHFYEHPRGQWLSFVREELKSYPDWAGNPEYFRFLGLVGIVAAQFGFPQLEGQLSRYSYHQWSQESPISSRHQLALATYTAGYILKSNEIKEGIIHDLADSKLEPGVIGLFFYPTGDTVEHPTHSDDNRRAAEERLQQSLPICLPDIELNTQLASIPFTGDDAERMPQAAFERDIYPEIQRITRDLDLLDPETIFVAP